MLEHAWTWLSCSGHDTYVLNKMFHVPNMAEHDNHVQNMTVVFCHVLEHDCHVLKQDSNIPEHDKTWLSCSGPCLSCCEHDGCVLYKMFRVHNITEHESHVQNMTAMFCHVPKHTWHISKHNSNMLEHAWTWLSCSGHYFHVHDVMLVFLTWCFMFLTWQNMTAMFWTWLPCPVMFLNMTDIFKTWLNMLEYACNAMFSTCYIMFCHVSSWLCVILHAPSPCTISMHTLHAPSPCTLSMHLLTCHVLTAMLMLWTWLIMLRTLLGMFTHDCHVQSCSVMFSHVLEKNI
jgi:hypothetical protein